MDLSDKRKDPLWALSLGALGIVFGDIGTSPLYAVRECFGGEHGVPVSPANIFGVLSLMVWTLIVVICIKYVWFILRADNKGEGGILSLMALAISKREDGLRKSLMIMLGVFGAALLFGDGIITPAISVVSAMEGINIAQPKFGPFILPLSVLILGGVFFLQRYGTGRIGFIFGPIIVIWFAALAVGGIAAIASHPEILWAFNPWMAVRFFIDNGEKSLLILGPVVLVVTGGEALYADMGHFGRSAIRWSWFAVVLPCLLLNYLGQGALLLKDPTAITNPFYLLFPEWARTAMIGLATLAAIIASQALISGIFSLTRQAVQLGFCPRMRIIHTSSREIGQIFVPFVNTALLILVVWFVLTFQKSSAMAGAYGVAVTGTMTITTILAFFVARYVWKWSLQRSLLVFGLFLIIDLVFLGSNLTKIMHGGWVPLAVAAGIYTLLSIWRKGRKILAEHLRSRSVSIEDFVQRINENPPLRVPGAAIYMSSDAWGVPLPLLHNLKHNKVLHETVTFLTIKTVEVPSVAKAKRVSIETIAPHFYRIVANYGFMETPKIKHILEACREVGINFVLTDTTFVLGRETILPTGHPEMAVWREKIFAVMARNAERPTAYFKIPPNQVIEVGIQVEI